MRSSYPTTTWSGSQATLLSSGPLVARVAAVLAAGGEIWIGDETTPREMPPLRSAWATRGEQAVVVISGRNSQRVIHGALNVRTGELVHTVRERSRQDDAVAFVTHLG